MSRVELTLKVNGGEPVSVTHTGPNGEPLKFQAADELFVEADWTLFDDDWLDVQLTFFEDGPDWPPPSGKRQRLRHDGQNFR